MEKEAGNAGSVEVSGGGTGLFEVHAHSRQSDAREQDESRCQGRAQGDVSPDSAYGGFKSLANRTPTMDTLIAIGATVAFATGFVTVAYDLGLAPKLLNYAGVGAMIMAIHLTGRFVETKARGRTSAAIQKLLSLACLIIS